MKSRRAEPTKKQRVIRELEKSILNGEVAPGDMIPPERGLAAGLGCSRVTIRPGSRGA